jgi:hypothetical protein
VNRCIQLILLLFGISAIAGAQIVASSTDVVGAHLNYGRGCAACHAPHSGASGNGVARTAEASSGSVALWGEDASGLYGQTIVTGGGSYVAVLPTSMSAGPPDVAGIMTCLSCHDGNYASQAMMKNRLYEALPATCGSANQVPTLIGLSGGGSMSYLSEHPVGLSALIGCGGSAWNCSEANGVISMKGANSSRFVNNYVFFVKPASYNNTAVAMCTTGHDPHVMNVVTVASGTASGLPAGTYATMFFLRGPCNPNDPNPQSNQTAQFCRQCHADLSNEVNGSTARTIF